MRRRDFQRLVDSLKSLSPHQLHQLNETVSGLVQKNEVRALIARQVEQSGQCPYCDAKEFRRWACPRPDVAFQLWESPSFRWGRTSTTSVGTYNGVLRFSSVLAGSPHEETLVISSRKGVSGALSL